MSKSRTTKQQGFTLIEVMIAMAIFAMLSLLAYQILSASVKNSEIAQEHTARLNEIQTAFSLLERDLIQILPRQSNTEEAFLSTTETSLRFTTIGSYAAAEPLSASDLAQVEWSITDHALTRSVNPQPSPSLSDASTLSTLTMLTGVRTLHWRFYSTGWTDRWSQASTFPAAIELIVTLEDMGEIRRLFLLPAAPGSTVAEATGKAPVPADSAPAPQVPMSGESIINE
ncbi:type II secretion system minor pseudopilin GspJ [Rahnella sp. PAMC25617]|uniref:type II secretion system minor pseudopilin GspJ n=1 Tax=Rahnella TaxID=34037 RepID=UPI00104D5B87|nr:MULTISPECIES: type II secretion system minor pseudopilin GspJ [Rahnella]TCQ83340.1 general secretion pathway protein J [Rahnella sp. JUb53]